MTDTATDFDVPPPALPAGLTSGMGDWHLSSVDLRLGCFVLEVGDGAPQRADGAAGCATPDGGPLH